MNCKDIVCDNYEDDSCSCYCCEGRDQIPINPDRCFKLNPDYEGIL